MRLITYGVIFAGECIVRRSICETEYLSIPFVCHSLISYTVVESVFQPPDGAHCPDCNVCVAGYDHHCVWMGTCIGKKNFKQFVRFNLSWIGYLLYAVLWITVVGPAVYHGKK